jgi:alpha-L-fucosidase
MTAAPEHAQTGYRPTPANLAAREWFQDARFGLFVHWGVYSVLGDGEWVMNNRRIPVADYEKLPALFNPVAFDPVEWVALAKAAGMKYITITSKHHDGFALTAGRAAEFSEHDFGVVVKLPRDAVDPIDTIVELVLSS